MKETIKTLNQLLNMKKQNDKNRKPPALGTAEFPPSGKNPAHGNEPESCKMITFKNKSVKEDKKYAGMD